MDNLLKEYRTVEQIHRRAMYFYGPNTLLMQLFSGQFILYCAFTLIRHRHQLDPFLNALITIIASFILCFWTLSLETAGRYQRDSTEVLISWKFMKHNDTRQAKLMRKYIKRFQPLVVSARSFFKIKRLTVLKYLKGIVRGTFRALLIT